MGFTLKEIYTLKLEGMGLSAEIIMWYPKDEVGAQAPRTTLELKNTLDQTMLSQTNALTSGIFPDTAFPQKDGKPDKDGQINIEGGLDYNTSYYQYTHSLTKDAFIPALTSLRESLGGGEKKPRKKSRRL